MSDDRYDEDDDYVDEDDDLDDDDDEEVSDSRLFGGSSPFVRSPSPSSPPGGSGLPGRDRPAIGGSQGGNRPAPFSSSSAPARDSGQRSGFSGSSGSSQSSSSQRYSPGGGSQAGSRPGGPTSPGPTGSGGFSGSNRPGSGSSTPPRSPGPGPSSSSSSRPGTGPLPASKPAADRFSSDKDKKDDKGGGGGAFSRVTGMFNRGNKDEPASASRSGAFRDSDSRSKPASSGGGAFSKVTGMFSRGKKDDKPGAARGYDSKAKPASGGGMMSRVTGMFSRGKKDDTGKAFDDRSRTSPGGGGGYGSRPGGATSSAQSARPGQQSAFGQSRGGVTSPAGKTGARDSGGKPGIMGRLSGVLPFGRGEPKAQKTSKTRSSKVPHAAGEGLSLDAKLDILGVSLVFGSLVLFFSSLSGQQGAITGGINNLFSQILGWGALGVPIAMLAAGVWLIIRHFGDDAPEIDMVRLSGVIMLYLGALMIFQFFETFNPLYQMATPDNLYLFIQESIRQGRGGGMVGAELYYLIVSNTGEIGGMFVILGWMTIGIMLTTRTTAGELAVFIISVWRSFQVAIQHRSQQRTIKRMEQQALASQQQISISKPVSGANAGELPAGAAAALPAPSDDGEPVPIEQRSIPIRMGGQILSQPASAEQQAEPVPLPITMPAAKAEPASGGRLGGLASRLRGAVPMLASRSGGDDEDEDEETTASSDESRPGGLRGMFASRRSTTLDAEATSAPSPAPSASVPPLPPAMSPASPPSPTPSAPAADRPAFSGGFSSPRSPGGESRPAFSSPTTSSAPAAPPATSPAPERESTTGSGLFSRPPGPPSGGSAFGRTPERPASPGGESRPAFSSPAAPARPPFSAPARPDDDDLDDIDEDITADAAAAPEDDMLSRLAPAQPKGIGVAPRPPSSSTFASRFSRPAQPVEDEDIDEDEDDDEEETVQASGESISDRLSRLNAIRSGQTTRPEGSLRLDDDDDEDDDDEQITVSASAATVTGKPTFIDEAEDVLEDDDDIIDDIDDDDPYDDDDEVIDISPDSSKAPVNNLLNYRPQPFGAASTPPPATSPAPAPVPGSTLNAPAARTESAAGSGYSPFQRSGGHDSNDATKRPVFTPPSTAASTPPAPVTPPASEPRINPPQPITPATPARPSAATAGQVPARGRKQWRLPDYRTLLASGSEQDFDRETLVQRARIIEETLNSFGAPGRVVEINTGPVITQFGVEPDYITVRGGKKTRVKVSAIAQLDKDLQLALGAKSIRIEAPVPGKGYVGVEVPNDEASLVSLRDVMESRQFTKIQSPLAIALGQSVDGAPVAADLSTMPHILIAGTTGSGKSVCVNSIITSLLIRNTPETVKFIMVDPKRVELTGYNGIPHLVAPVVVELERIVGVLKWVTREMDERYKRFSDAGARNIEDFNAHLAPEAEPMPYIVVIIDELADLMMLAPDETERVVTRIAALARATGIHLVIATQRPSVDVVTGLIKANFPARVAFAVAGGVDSRVILDQPGAEKLLGRGDMLYMSGDSPAPVRLQGVYVSDMEINNINRYWRSQQPEAAPPKPITSLVMDEVSDSRSVLPKSERFVTSSANAPQRAFWDRDPVSTPAAARSSSDDGDENDGEDELYSEAVEMVRRLNKASVSLLQRRLRIGYTRAARLIDMMEEQGVVGPATEGSKPREVLPVKR